MDHLTILNQNAGNFNWPDAVNIFHYLNQVNGEVVTTESLSHLEEILKKNEENQPKIIGLGGGDGTASRTLTLVDKIWGKIPEHIASYPMGTMNNISIFSGVHSFWDKIKRRIGGKTKPVQLADYISTSIQEDLPLNTKDIALLDNLSYTL